MLDEAGVVSTAQSFVDVVRYWARQRPDNTAYCFLEKGREVGRLSFKELDERARAIAANLQRREAQGERAILLFPQGLDYLCAFLGCLYAGTVAVTGSLPKGDRRSERVLSIMDDSGARFALTDKPTLAQLEADAQRLRGVSWITLEHIAPESGRHWMPPALTLESLAFLQYTSGSTSSPKGVMLSHGNLTSNHALMVEGMGNHGGSVFVSWVPLFHDMGLIGMALSSLYNGAPCYLLSPDDFVRRPVLWLEAISKYRGTVTAAPDFAYRLCVDQIPSEQVEALDLSSLQTMVCGAEPVRVSTIERFVERFGPAGLRAESMYAGYGLAESSVWVSGEHITDGVTTVDRKALEQGRVVEAGEEPIRLISCGRTTFVDVRIVEPESHRQLPEKQVGEIWVNSPSNGKGYWGKPELSKETFQARIEGRDQGGYLRTGDLGFVIGDRLYICGRIKDLIIIRGRNIYPDDVASVVEASDERLKSRPASAFSIDTSEQEELVIVVTVKASEDEHGALIDAIRRNVANRVGVEAGAVIIVPNNNIARTTSGKIQHVRIKQNFLAHGLNIKSKWMSRVVEEWWRSLPVSDIDAGTYGLHTSVSHKSPDYATFRFSDLLAYPQDRWHKVVEGYLVYRIPLLADQAQQPMSPEMSVVQIGLDSLKLMTLLEDIERRFLVDLSLAELGKAPR